MIVTSYFTFTLIKEFYIAQAQGLEIRFSNFPIMVIGSHDFPCFFLVENHVFPPIINNFLPIIDRLPWIATSEATSLCHRLYNKHTCREVSPGLDALRVAGSFPNPRCVQSRTHRTCKYVWFLSHAISVKSTEEFYTHFSIYNFFFG